MSYSNDLAHFGILGMKWGIRRYQNKDGSLTQAGKDRQRKQEEKQTKKNEKSDAKIIEQVSKDSTRNSVRAWNESNKVMNGEGPGSIAELNRKWEPKFAGVENWATSPLYKSYVDDYSARVTKVMNDVAKNDSSHNVKLSDGGTLQTRYLSENGNFPEVIIKKVGGRKT
jgi:ribosomal protein S30